MNIQTQYSILQALLSPEDAVKLAKARGYDKLILCDRNGMGGIVEFYKTCKKQEIKPIFGVCLKVCEYDSIDKGEHNLMYDLYLVAKTQVGYKNILKIVSLANDHTRVLDTPYQRVARIHLNDITHLTEGVACLIGEEGTELERNKGFEEYTVSKYQKIFPEVLLQDCKSTKSSLEYGMKRILWHTMCYAEPEDKRDQHILLSTFMGCFLKDLPERVKKDWPDFNKYISDDDHSLPMRGDLHKYHSEEVLRNTEEFLSSVEDFSILSPPKIPKFDCPDGMSQKEYLTYLCRLGWIRRFKDKEWKEGEKEKYTERVKYELDVLQGCNLDGYFLIVQDYINWAKRQGWLVGHGRGSCSASIIAYLLGITEVDPMIYNLLFERFYSADRASTDTPSLPDIDTDFPKYKRGEVISYIEQKYGKNRVGHIATFGTLQSKAALKAVLKAHESFPLSKIDKITRTIPQKDKISDLMEEQKEDCTLMFTLMNYPDILKELATIQRDGDKIQIVGEYAYQVEQAIRLEGCICNYGSHASGILVAESDLENFGPMMISAKGEDKLVGLDMNASAEVSLVKLDILGLSNLDSLMEMRALLLGESDDQ